MSAAQMLSRVGLKTVRFDTGNGGVPALLPEEMLMHLGMYQAAGCIDEIAVIFAIAFYTNTTCRKDQELIKQYLGSRVFIKCRKEKIRVTQQTIQHIVSLAISESINSTVCPACNGTKKVLLAKGEFNMQAAIHSININDSKYKTCKACKGTGYKLLSNYKKAVTCGMSGGKSWTDNHELLLGFTQQIITGWLSEIKNALATIHS